MIKKKRKESRTGYVHKSWKLSIQGLCIYHSILWSRKGPPDKYYTKNVRVKITIEEV